MFASCRYSVALWYGSHVSAAAASSLACAASCRTCQSKRCCSFQKFSFQLSVCKKQTLYFPTAVVINIDPILSDPPVAFLILRTKNRDRAWISSQVRPGPLAGHRLSGEARHPDLCFAERSPCKQAFLRPGCKRLGGRVFEWPAVSLCNLSCGQTIAAGSREECPTMAKTSGAAKRPGALGFNAADFDDDETDMFGVSQRLAQLSNCTTQPLL